MHPYQCLAAVLPSKERTDSGEYLIAACGPKLLSFCLTAGVVVSEWSTCSAASAPAAENGEDDGGRPKKKQKKSLSISNSTPNSTPSIIKLTLSPDQQHAVVVTDDKFLRVFELQFGGRLVEASQRCMPKRPCAVHVLPDNNTILCGDKFGDVYSLPLGFQPFDEDGDVEAGAEDKHATVEKLFRPSATDLTVHTNRNRKALEAQLKQNNFTPRKEPLRCKHKLLLGHVSMLTDMTFDTHEVNGKQLGYIITADRDEHIRISRGPPQAHIIEGYCLGHTEFVSKLCRIPGTDLVVSGGGDDWLGVWDWTTCKLKARLDLRKSMKIALGTVDSHNAHEIAVSGIWIVPLTSHEQTSCALAVACEKVSALFTVSTASLIASEVKQSQFTVLQLSHPPLDVTSICDRMIVSLDGRSQHDKRLQAYQIKSLNSGYKDLQVKPDGELGQKLEALNTMLGQEIHDNALDQLLYGVGGLRKRKGHGEAEEVEGDVLEE